MSPQEAAALAPQLREVSTPRTEARPRPIGRIVSVSGAQAVVRLISESDYAERLQLGVLLRIPTRQGSTLGIVSGATCPVPAQAPDEKEMRLVEIELVGQINAAPEGERPVFVRGVHAYPALGDYVFSATRKDLEVVFARSSDTCARVGHLQQDREISATVRINQLLTKHVAIVGATGAGKSCLVALTLRRILDVYPSAHVVILDPHNEYGEAFDDRVEKISPDDLQLPFWLLTFEELVEVFFGGDVADRSVEIETLRDLIPLAKQQYRAMGEDTAPRAARRLREPAAAAGHGPAINVDSPVPFKLSDVAAMLDAMMGKLDKPENLAPFKRLKARMESLTADPRFAFMFGGLNVRDVMQDVLARVFRIPVDGRPVAVMDLSGVPAEVLKVVVSVVCRLAFDLAMWSDRRLPITIVCEEAHRYMPRDRSLGFAPATRSAARIAKEGRKYGVSLFLVTQRPAELDPTILSQASTLFAMRLTNQIDQEIVRAAVSDSATSLLDVLPALGNGEALALGEGVSMPMRIQFDRLPAQAVPRSNEAVFAQEWTKDRTGEERLAHIIDRWRSQQR